jgi:hypothetical protein
MPASSVTVVWPDGLAHNDVPRLAAALAGGSLPYHSVIGLGSRRRLGEEAAAWWPVAAPLVEEVWNAATSQARPPTADDVLAAGRALIHRFGAHLPHHRLPAELARRLVDAGVAAQALSCAQSVATVRSRLGEWPADARYLREGHVSSVFVIRPADADAYVLNVARDACEAADDLLRAARLLGEWSRTAAELVAGTVSRDNVTVPWLDLQVTVPVVGSRLVPDARELHVVAAGDDGRGLLVEVEDFTQGPSGTPVPTPRAQPDVEESHERWAQTAVTRCQLARVEEGSSSLTAPSVELNDGDAVSTSRSPRAPVAFVGTDPEVWSGPLWDWPFEIALASTYDETGPPGARLWWASPERALPLVGQLLSAPGSSSARQAGLRTWRLALAEAVSATPEDVAARHPEAPAVLVGRTVGAVRRLPFGCEGLDSRQPLPSRPGGT